MQFGVPVGRPGEVIEWEASHTSLELEREVWAIDAVWELSCIDYTLKLVS